MKKYAQIAVKASTQKSVNSENNIPQVALIVLRQVKI